MRDYTLSIIAMMAHAMASNRTKCLDIGCNEYLTNLIERSWMTQILHRFIATEQGGTGQLLVSEFADDPDMVELISEFIAHLSEQTEQLEQALSQSDLGGLRQAVHKLTGAVGGYGTFCAIHASPRRLPIALR